MYILFEVAKLTLKKSYSCSFTNAVILQDRKKLSGSSTVFGRPPIILQRQCTVWIKTFYQCSYKINISSIVFYKITEQLFNDMTTRIQLYNVHIKDESYFVTFMTSFCHFFSASICLLRHITTTDNRRHWIFEAGALITKRFACWNLC